MVNEQRCDRAHEAGALLVETVILKESSWLRLVDTNKLVLLNDSSG